MKFYSMLFLLFPTILYGQVNIPSKVDNYQPIIASSQSDADVYIWSVPEPALYVTVDNGKAIHVWAPVGKYNVKLTTIKVAWEDKKISYDNHVATFEVVGSTPVPPTPNPTPDPTPTAFKQKVEAALSKVSDTGKTYKKNIANNYTAIATEVSLNPKAWDVATMVNEAKTRNATVLPSSVMSGWSGFWPDLARALQELKLDSTDLEGHVKAFNDIASVLNK